MDKQHHAFFQSDLLEDKSSAYVALVTLRSELYGGNHEKMVDDLKVRRCRSPYIYKLVVRINADLSRLDKIKEYETRYGINLYDVLERQRQEEATKIE